MKIKLAILGCGNMGSAIALGLAKKSKHFSFYTYTPTFVRALALAKAMGGKAVRNVSDLKHCDYFLIACKPQQFAALAPRLKKILNKNSKIISIMAGISTPHLKKMLGCKKIARAMPNTPSLIGEGVTSLYSVSLNKKEKETVKKMFSAVGQVYPVGSDDKINLATALIGSGPAYIFEIARILTKKLAAHGIHAKQAESMVKQLFKGAGLLMSQTKESLETLRNNVTSKKGTTEAALKFLKSAGLEKILHAASHAAYQRAKKLARH